MRGPAVQPIVIAAGGTGGHFFPAEALAAELVARGHRIVLMTDARSGGLASPTFAGREQYVIRGAGIAGRGVWRGVKAVGSLGGGCGAGARHSGRDRRRLCRWFRRLSMRRADPCRRTAAPPATGHPARAECGAGTGKPFPGEPGGCAGTGFREHRAVAPEHQPKSPAIRCGRRSLHWRRPAISTATRSASGCWCSADRLAPGCSATWCRRRCEPLPDAMRAGLSVVQQTRPEDLERVRAAYAGSGIKADLSPFFPDMAARLAGRIWSLPGRALPPWPNSRLPAGRRFWCRCQAQSMIINRPMLGRWRRRAVPGWCRRRSSPPGS